MGKSGPAAPNHDHRNGCFPVIMENSFIKLIKYSIKFEKWFNSILVVRDKPRPFSLGHPPIQFKYGKHIN